MCMGKYSDAVCERHTSARVLKEEAICFMCLCMYDEWETRGRQTEHRNCSAGVLVNPRERVYLYEMKVGRDDGDGGWMTGKGRGGETGGGSSAPVLSPWVHQQQELFSALWGPSDCSVTLHRRLTLP